MRTRSWAVAVAAACAVSCAAWADDDGGRGKGARRAEKHCAREAEDLGLRVAKIGDVERVGKKQYEVRLRVEERDRERWDDRWDRRDGRDRDDFRVVCRYDDRERLARID